MKRRQLIYVAWAAIFIFAMALRLPGLTQRPMHTDEAVHAIKFSDLLERNNYRYDPHEYHGPTLNYFTLIPAWLTGAKTLSAASEITLRIVPAFFGLLLIPLIWLLSPWLNRSTLLWMSLFTAISPALSYYSRYYIMEMMLLAFTLGWLVVWLRYWRDPKISWLITGAISLGLMMATKETWILNAIAALAATGLILIQSNNSRMLLSDGIQRIPQFHFIIAPIAVLFVAGLFFSSFGSNWHGLIDAVRAYSVYFRRAEGSTTVHEHPWYYYAHLLLWYKMRNGPLWSEGIIVLLASWGVVQTFRKSISENPVDRWIACYTLVLAVIYSIIPYKTPWNLLSFWQPIILLAGIGWTAVFRLNRSWKKWMIIGIGSCGILHLGWQSWQANFRYAASPANPYVYGHTSPDIFRIVGAVHTATKADNGDQTYIEVICPNDDYWPLPWYFRKYPNVGYWNHVSMKTPAAPIIIVAPVVEQSLLNKLYVQPPPGQRPLYVPLIDSSTELRPGVELRSYVIKALWDRMR
ncbi:TIGR03663 family protein [candidate division KSB1 bacterium]|nr:TIGR03663 family protein [candidate division KSB1 bacterium]